LYSNLQLHSTQQLVNAIIVVRDGVQPTHRLLAKPVGYLTQSHPRRLNEVAPR